MPTSKQVVLDADQAKEIGVVVIRNLMNDRINNIVYSSPVHDKTKVLKGIKYSDVKEARGFNADVETAAGHVLAALPELKKQGETIFKDLHDTRVKNAEKSGSDRPHAEL